MAQLNATTELHDRPEKQRLFRTMSNKYDGIFCQNS